MSYSSYDHDDLELASTMRIERRIYFESGKADLSEMVKLPLAELLSLRAESAAAEQEVFDRLKAQAATWEEQAGRTLFLDKALEYARTLPVTHTANQWEAPDEYRHIRSNMVYQMDYSISENTRYDSAAKKSVPYSWTLRWGLYTNAPHGNRREKIAGQDRKVFASREELDKYLNGRIKAHDHYFTEISPAIPKEYAECFKVNGCLLPGYTIEGEEPAKAAELPTQEEAAQPQQTTATPERREPVNEVFSIFLDNRAEAQTGGPHGYWLSLPTSAEQVQEGEKAIKILAPAPFKAKKEVQKLDAQGRPVMGKDGKPVTEVQEIQVPAFKIVSVFDVSQTEGEPLPSIGVEELTGSVERYGEFFKALEQTSPVPIGFEDIPGGSHGYYHLTEKRIAIQEGMSELQTLKTAIHEIAHSKLHAIDPEAPAIEQADRPDSRTREVQAESVAYAVCQHYGLDTSDYSFGYVAGWSSGKDLKELKASLETIRATAHELISTIDGHLAQLQKERQAQQEQPQAAPLERAAEQPDPDSAFSKLPPEQQQEMTDSVKAMLQTLIEADLKSTGEVSQGTKEAAQAQGFTIARDGTLEQAEAPQEAAYRLESGDYLYIQTSETGYDYTLYGPDYKELDGGQLDNPDLSLAEAGKEILAIHELPAGAMELLTGDRLDGFLEATEQANAIPRPQAWNGIDGLLNGKPFMPEASPADRAAALIELAEKNAPRLGSEERQLIVAYAEAVGDNDKVIGLINCLCEQGYELQKGQMDSFVKSEIESEIAVANAQRQIAQNPAAEPVVTILWSESPHLKDGQQMPLHEAEAVFKELDSARRHDREQPDYTGHWYDKTKFRIDFTMQGQPDSYEGRQDFGDGDGSLIQHIRGYHEYYAQDESWKNHVLHHEGPEAWEADKAQRDMLLHEFVPYMELHCNLAAMEQEARRPLRSGETLTPEQTAYFNAVLDYVKECRPLLNQSQYHLPEPPQLSDFGQSLQDYKKQIEAELEQEAAAAGLTVEEYVASDYEAPAQPNFSIYQVPPGPEGRDFRYRSYEDLQADGLSVDRKNYQLVYTAPLDKDTTLDEIYRRFNMEHPADYKGHSLSMGDIVVFRQDGKQTAYYVDEGADYRQVPEFFAQPEKQLTPDECMTGEQIQTPRGRFYLTDRSREQMEAAGYGFHHQSEDGRYLIMANGTRAFAIPAQPESHIKTAEMSTEQNYNMIDGMMNNAPSMEELEARAKAGEQISLLDVAEAAKAEAKKPKQTRKTTQKQKKPSIRAQLAAAKEEQKKKPPAREKSKEMEV